MTEGSLRAMVDRGIERKVRSSEPKLEEEAEYQAFAFGRVGPKTCLKSANPTATAWCFPTLISSGFPP